MFYYAIIDTTNNYVTGVTVSETEIAATNLVAITEEQYTATVNGDTNSLISYVYNAETATFTNPVEWWSCSSDEVKVGQTETKTSAKLYALENAILDNAAGIAVLDEDIATLGETVSNKANANHSHTAAEVGAAEATHTHTAADITGLPSQVDAYTKTESDNRYATSDHTHTDFALASDFNALCDTVDDKADSGHTHTASTDIAGLATVATSGSYNDLADKPTIPTEYTHPATHSADMITGLAEVATSGSYDDLTDKPTIPDAYEHPATHAASMITGLSEVATSGSYDDLTDKPTIPAAYTHPTSHPASMITGLADVATSGDYNDLDNKPTSLPPTAHTHAQSEVTGLETALNQKANTSHTHAQDDITGLATALSGKAAANHNHDTVYAPISHTHAQSEVSGLTTALAGKAAATHTHTLDDVTETTDKKVMTAAERTKLSGIATGANKTTVDSALSSSSTNPVQNKVVNTALSGKVDKVDGKGLSTNDYTTTEKNKLAGIAAGANAYTHPSYTAKSSGLYKVTVDATGHVSGATAVTKSDITGLGIPSTNTTYSAATTSAAGLMSAADKTKLDGIATGANKTTVDSALSSTSTNPVQNKVINSALAGKAATSHNHDTVYSNKALQITSDTGSFKYSYKTDDGVNVLTAIKSLASGVFTVYSQAGVAGNPKTTEAWRMLVHKTGDTVLWVKAFGSAGSEYSNYCADGVWQGWRCIYDDVPEPLWSGEMYMAATHTIIPTKALSDCRNGWLLIWSDYNPGDSVQNVDFTTTVIPKRAYNGALWNGHQFLCTVPKHSDTSGDGIIIKTLHISDTQIVGNSLNNVSPRNDVVLRAVYEF